MSNSSIYGARAVDHARLPANVTRERAAPTSQKLESTSIAKLLGEPTGFEVDADEKELPFTD
jgi:hypothetical protein